MEERDWGDWREEPCASGRPPAPRSWPGGMLSVALHGGAILALTHATRPSAPPLPPIVLDSAIVVPGPVRPAHSDRAAERPIDPLADDAPGPLPDLEVPITVPDGIPPVDLSGAVLRAPRGSLPRSIFDPPGGGGSGDVFAAAAVDEPPVRLFSPPIEYPVGLARAGVEGTVVIEAVVDTVGTVEPGSVGVICADHPGLAASAQRVVERSRFRPGHVRGAPLRVVVRVPVMFVFGFLD